MSSDAKAKVKGMIQGTEGQTPPKHGSWGGLDLARDMPAAMEAYLRQYNSKSLLLLLTSSLLKSGMTCIIVHMIAF